MPPAHIGLFGESPALVRNAEGAIPPGNAQAHGRQTAATCKGLRGFWRAAHGLKADAHRRGAARAYAPDLSGHRTEGRLASRGVTAHARCRLRFNSVPP